MRARESATRERERKTCVCESSKRDRAREREKEAASARVGTYVRGCQCVRASGYMERGKGVKRRFPREVYIRGREREREASFVGIAGLMMKVQEMF